MVLNCYLNCKIRDFFEERWEVLLEFIAKEMALIFFASSIFFGLDSEGMSLLSVFS